MIVNTINDRLNLTLWSLIEQCMQGLEIELEPHLKSHLVMPESNSNLNSRSANYGFIWKVDDQTRNEVKDIVLNQAQNLYQRVNNLLRAFEAHRIIEAETDSNTVCSNDEPSDSDSISSENETQSSSEDLEPPTTQFRPKRLSDEEKEIFICPKGDHYLKEPIVDCENGHSICQICKSDRCPVENCIYPQKIRRNRGLERIIYQFKLPIQCKNVRLGCSFSAHGDVMKRHEVKCWHTQIDCPLLTCDESLNILNLDNHVNEKHKELKEEKWILQRRPNDIITLTKSWLDEKKCRRALYLQRLPHGTWTFWQAIGPRNWPEERELEQFRIELQSENVKWKICYQSHLIHFADLKQLANGSPNEKEHLVLSDKVVHNFFDNDLINKVNQLLTSKRKENPNVFTDVKVPLRLITFP